MRAQLRVDGEELAAAARRIQVVVDSLAQEGATMSDAASHVGHDALAKRVREFESAWDIHRGWLVDDVSQVAAMLIAINDTFSDLDRETATKIKQAMGASDA